MIIITLMVEVESISIFLILVFTLHTTNLVVVLVMAPTSSTTRLVIKTLSEPTVQVLPPVALSVSLNRAPSKSLGSVSFAGIIQGINWVTSNYNSGTRPVVATVACVRRLLINSGVVYSVVWSSLDRTKFDDE